MLKYNGKANVYIGLLIQVNHGISWQTMVCYTLPYTLYDKAWLAMVRHCLLLFTMIYHGISWYVVYFHQWLVSAFLMFTVSDNVHGTCDVCSVPLDYG